jgi:hypothetical protein
VAGRRPVQLQATFSVVPRIVHLCELLGTLSEPGGSTELHGAGRGDTAGHRHVWRIRGEHGCRRIQPLRRGQPQARPTRPGRHGSGSGGGPAAATRPLPHSASHTAGLQLVGGRKQTYARQQAVCMASPHKTPILSAAQPWHRSCVFTPLPQHPPACRDCGLACVLMVLRALGMRQHHMGTLLEVGGGGNCVVHVPSAAGGRAQLQSWGRPSPC